MKIAPEDCQFHFSEPIQRDEGDCLSCVVRTTQRNQKKLESMKLEDFHVANLKFPPSPSPPPPQSHPKRESWEEGDDEDTLGQSVSQPPTPREIVEPRTVSVEGEVEPFTPKKLVRKMSEGMKKMARRLSKKK
ncbi:hypothetical protein BOTNAR_0198g00170 [Botryotinia narcissicola]|uniref:Uncharacterized protein n=1 Tax=Botryotinia narcissicola TaxID=278944 RepID=A0A4Z1ILN5_9HELO|nr:hypothetical protein BOTNAR_0198g00170 [Botryotinia narcissicola]